MWLQNKKNIRRTIIVCSIFSMLYPAFFTGCATTRTIVSDNGVSTTETRDTISTIENQQADSAAAAQSVTDKSTDIAEQSTDIAAGIDEATNTLAGGTDNDEEFEQLCEQIRNQPSDASKTNSSTSE